MAEQTYIVISGNGETSRNNVEALVSDYIVMLKQEKKTPVILLVGQNRFTLPQTWAAQYAKDLGVDCVAISQSTRSAESLSHASFALAEDPFSEAAKIVEGSEAYGFLAWEEGDEDSALALEALSKVGVKCFDLTNGLYDIAPSVGTEAVMVPVKPVEPVAVPTTLPEAPKAPEGTEELIRRVADRIVEALIKELNA